MHHVLDAIQLVGGAGPLSAAEANAVLAHLNLHEEGTIIAQIIGWGPWLVPLGYLGYRSGFFPRTIAMILIIGGIGLTLQGIQYFLMPSHGRPDDPIHRGIRDRGAHHMRVVLVQRNEEDSMGHVEKERRVDPSEADAMTVTLLINGWSWTDVSSI